MTHRSSKGYVLLMTLVVLTLAAIGAVSVARRSMSMVGQADQSLKELQRKWAMQSLESVILPQLPELWQRYETTQAAVSGDRLPLTLVDVAQPTMLQTQVTLAGQALTLYLSDEQAKLNINALAKQMNPRQLEQWIQEDPQVLRLGLKARCRPTPSPATSADPLLPAYASVDQVLPGLHPSHGLPDESGHSGWYSQWTFWGNGQLNIKRAAASSLARLTAAAMDGAVVQEIERIRQQMPNVGVEHLMNQAKIPTDQKDAMLLKLTSQSSCYSLWVVQQDSVRSWYGLSILERTPGGTYVVHRQVW